MELICVIGNLSAKFFSEIYVNLSNWETNINSIMDFVIKSLVAEGIF